MTKLTGSLGVRNEINVDIKGSGPRGERGKSAYEIWLDLGNEGTEQEFLASLKGQDGHTPVKGTDYWTTADQTAIVADVLAAVDELILGGAS